MIYLFLVIAYSLLGYLGYQSFFAVVAVSNLELSCNICTSKMQCNTDHNFLLNSGRVIVSCLQRLVRAL